jgi:Plasmid encoded RepA protein
MGFAAAAEYAYKILVWGSIMGSTGHQLSLWARDLAAGSHHDWVREEAKVDVSFLHRGFCIMGMPLRQPKDSLRPFSRHDGRFALTIEPASVTHPDGGLVNIGVPFGPKARLIAMWMATEVQNPRRNTADGILELNGITDWLEALGIPARGGPTGSIAATKDQFMRLAFSTFTMVLRGPNSEELFKREALIESGIFSGDDLALYRAGQISQMAWPRVISLTHNAYDRFLNDAIPIPTGRLREVANNAMAIDILVYLSYRLPMLSRDDTAILTWRDLMAQFGNGSAGEFASKFKETFRQSIRRAIEAYPEARVEITSEGLVMRYSDPVDLRRAFVALPGDGTKLPRRRGSGSRVHLNSIEAPNREGMQTYMAGKSPGNR